MATKKKVASTAKKAAPAKKTVKKVISKTAAPKAKVAPKKAAPAKGSASKSQSAKAAPVKKESAKKPAPKPAAKGSASKSASKSVAKPAAKSAVKPAVKPAAKPASTSAKSGAKKAVAAKPVAKPSGKTAGTAKTAASGSSKSAPAASVKPAGKKIDAKIAAQETQKAKSVGISSSTASTIRAAEERRARRASTGSSVVYKPEPSVLDQPAQPHGPAKRYSDAELKEFKEIIVKKLESAKKELTYLQGLITRKDEAGTDDTENKYISMEDGSGTMEREQLNQLASRQIQYIDHLEKALMRIENKTYGICRVTGKLIDKARLKAVPHATLSIEAKQAMNK